MKFKAALSVFLISVALLAGCANTISSSSRDMANINKVLLQSSPVEFESVLNEFVQAANRKDADTMLSVTSDITRKSSGDENLKKLYQADYFEMLGRFNKISTGGTSRYIKGKDNSEGWAFERTLTDKDGYSIGIKAVTIKPSEKIYIYSFVFLK